jgi:AbrB family looped-hinge helix DNA binding protein
MRVAIDGVGRVVIPKPMRQALGINGPTELELTEHDGSLELSVPHIKAHIETRDGWAVIVADEPVPALTAEIVRGTLERVRK